MKIGEIFEEVVEETAASGMTSVASIGQIEYQAFPNRVKLYRSDCDNNHQCVAVIKRNKNDGWRFSPTKNWGKQKLEHFGHLTNIKSSQKGMKTISNNLESMLKAWGIKYDEVIKKK